MILVRKEPVREPQTLASQGTLANWQEVVYDPNVKLVSVCTPNDTHAEIAIAALNEGKHVWCEKPMSSSLSDSKKNVRCL